MIGFDIPTTLLGLALVFAAAGFGITGCVIGLVAVILRFVVILGSGPEE